MVNPMENINLDVQNPIEKKKILKILPDLLKDKCNFGAN